jgi:hypothetical protein
MVGNVPWSGTGVTVLTREGCTDEASSQAQTESRAAVWVDDATGQTGSSWAIYEFARKRQPSSSRVLKFEAKHWNFICDALESAEGAISGRAALTKPKPQVQTEGRAAVWVDDTTGQTGGQSETARTGIEYRSKRPANELKRNGCRGTRRRCEQCGRFLCKWTADLAVGMERPTARVLPSKRPRAV